MIVTIDGVEIKSVINGVFVSGNINSVSRTAKFEYVYSPYDDEFAVYFANIGSSVVISNAGENIFSGRVVEISFLEEKNLIRIQAQDFLSSLLNTKAYGRYKGELFEIISKVTSGHNFNLNLNFPLKQRLNIVSTGNLSLMDVLLASLFEIFEDNFKLYVDGNSSLKLFTPLLSKPVYEFEYGKNIVSSSHKINDDTSYSTITVKGDDTYIVSGEVIKLTDNFRNISAEFVVENDTHIYDNIHTMVLNLKAKEQFNV